MIPDLKILKVVIISTLVALCVATNYALVGVYNVKVMDFIVFAGGFCLGPLAGALIGILSWAVYGVINPHGFVPRIWLATMFSEPIYGLIGGVLGKKYSSANFNDQRLWQSVFFGAMGFLLTLVYDMVTNVAYASVYDVPIMVSFFIGTPFTLTHEVSNAAIFGFGSISTIKALENLLGGGDLRVGK